VTDMAEFARTLWIEARPMVVVQATEAVEAAEAWAAEGDSASWRRLEERSHQLAGSLGSYAAAMRPRDAAAAGSTEPSTTDQAAAAALELDATVHEAEPDAARIVAATQRLLAAVEQT
jgi:hypothetical protein